MGTSEKEPLEIRIEDLAEEPVESPSSARLVIRSEDLAEEPREYPGFTGAVPVAGIHVVAHCATRKGEYVLSLTPRKEKGGGYWMQVEKGKSATAVGGILAVSGPFAYRKDFACPLCGAQNIIVCECGAVFCHTDKPTTTCPVCQKKLRIIGAASHLNAYGGSKGGG